MLNKGLSIFDCLGYKPLHQNWVFLEEHHDASPTSKDLVTIRGSRLSMCDIMIVSRSIIIIINTQNDWRLAADKSSSNPHAASIYLHECDGNTS